MNYLALTNLKLFILATSLVMTPLTLYVHCYRYEETSINSFPFP